MRRTKFKLYVKCLRPDGSVIDIGYKEDGLSCAEGIIFVSDEEKKKIAKEIAEGIGTRISPYYDEDGNFKGSEVNGKTCRRSTQRNR